MSMLVAFTVAFGTTALLASFTVPETLPPTPAHESTAKSMRNAKERNRAIRVKHFKAK